MALVADLPMLLVVNPSLPVKNVAELIAYAKANPDKLAYSSSGNGTLSHLGMEEFKQRAGITMLHVPYRGSAPAMTDLVAGMVGVAMDTVTVTEPFIQAGKMRADRQRLFAARCLFAGYADAGRAGLCGVRHRRLARHRRLGRRRRRSASRRWMRRSARSCSPEQIAESSPRSA